jgi:NADH:ubiquinone oxidoreductase subunit C
MNSYLISSVIKFGLYFLFYSKLYYYFILNNYILKLCSFLFLDINSRYRLLADITAVDFLSKLLRFIIIHNFISMEYNVRLLLFSNIKELDKIDSIIILYPSANWYEREVWDLFGIIFLNHFDLRRILTDYGFIGYPMRKDFPLSGFKELYYDFSIENILYRHIKLTQSYRLFQRKITK